MNRERRRVFQIVIISICSIFVIKLFFIQVIDSHYAELADSNAILKVIEYPYRGLIYDRNGKLIVYNTPEFEIEVLLNKVKEFDSVKFCELFGLSRQALRDKFKELRSRQDFSSYKPIPFLNRLTISDFAKVEDRLDEFQGFNVVARTARAYEASMLANTLGYVSEISKNQLQKDSVNFYRRGDYIGQSGIESFYEEQLRGKRGVSYKLRNVKGILKGSFKNGAYDTLSVPGQDLTTGIDLSLQEYGEMLLKGKTGSIVAIEPSSGEVLSLVSGPSYNPDLLTGKSYSSNFLMISRDTNKPLFNRPLMAQYRPASIFKIAQALTALKEGIVIPETRVRCNRAIINCHGRHYNEDLRGAIANSCNPYFYTVFKNLINKNVVPNTYEDTRIGLDEWSQNTQVFGFGVKLGVDLNNEKPGLIPTSSYYNRMYNGRPWKFSNIYSLSIGEGENLVVPIQMANFVSIIANKGFYYIPHVVKAIGNSGSPFSIYEEKQYTDIDSSYYTVIADAMQQVVDVGTGFRAKLKDIVVCGKTGTVQNASNKPDHSVFIAFAPRDNPKIGISVYVENAGAGSGAAASIASLMIEKYLIGKTERPYIENYVLKGEFVKKIN